MTTRQGMHEQRARLVIYLHAMEAYCAAKLAARDWHGVRDAAADIEIAEAKLVQIDLTLSLLRSDEVNKESAA